jgi:hypothetical protein
MTITNVREGDIVEVDKLGRRFHAEVLGKTGRMLTIRPLDRRITYTQATSREVINHWRKSRVGARKEPTDNVEV